MFPQIIARGGRIAAIRWACGPEEAQPCVVLLCETVGSLSLVSQYGVLGVAEIAVRLSFDDREDLEERQVVAKISDRCRGSTDGEHDPLTFPKRHHGCEHEKWACCLRERCIRLDCN